MYKIENILNSYIKKNINSDSITTEIVDFIIMETKEDILLYINQLCNLNNSIIYNSTIYLPDLSVYNNIYPIEYYILSDICELKFNGCLFSKSDINDIYIEHLFLIKRYLNKILSHN